MPTQSKSLKVNATNTVKDLIEKYRGDFHAVLPRHLSVDRLMRVVTTAMRKSPKLLDCEPSTILGCVMEASILGLEVDSHVGHAYMVPFRNSKRGSWEAQLIPGYRGLIKLAKQSGDVDGIKARVVFDCDVFDELDGSESKIIHRPRYEDRQNSKPIGAYAVATFPSGNTQFEFMSAAEIEKVKKRSMSGSKGYGPWCHEDDWSEMWKKTVTRRLCKYLSLSSELQRAVGLDEQHEAGLSQKMNDIMPPEEYSVSDETEEDPEILPKTEAAENTNA